MDRSRHTWISSLVFDNLQHCPHPSKESWVEHERATEAFEQQEGIPRHGMVSHTRRECKKLTVWQRLQTSFSNQADDADGLCTLPSGSHPMRTRRTTTRMVRNRVLGITELFEQILLQLPPVDTMRLRRVCKGWRDVIQGSCRIGQKLFLLCAPPTRVWTLDRYTAELYPCDDDENTRRLLTPQELAVWKMRYYGSRPSEWNPLLFRQEPAPRRGSLLLRAHFCESLRLAARPDLSKRVGSCICHWMFVTQPPVTEVTFTFHYNIPRRDRDGAVYSDHIIRLDVSNRNGVRFGQLLEKFLDEAPSVHHRWDQDHPHFPATEYKIKINPVGVHGRPKSVVWTLGAIFVDEEEYAAVMKRDRSVKPSPLAQEMMRKTKHDVEPERSYRWWSEDDAKWARDDEAMRRRAEDTKRLPLFM